MIWNDIKIKWFAASETSQPSEEFINNFLNYQQN